jgi:hypothetical protein
MTFPSQIPNKRNNKQNITYRGFPIWTETYGSRGGSADISGFEQSFPTTYLHIGLPTRVPFFQICQWGHWYGQDEQSREGAISIGFPPFDRRFFIDSNDADTVRRVMTPQMAWWLLTIDWERSALRDHKISVGLDSIYTKAGDRPNLADFMIDFLYRMPTDLWSTPLPAIADQPS